MSANVREAREADDAEIIDVARGGGWNLAGGAFNQLLRFTITLLLARLLGRAEAGLFFQSFAVLAVLGLIASGGFRLSLTRFVAVHRADSDPGALRGTVRLGLLFSTGAGVVLGVGLFVAAPWFANDAFGDPEMVSLLRLVAVTLPATVFTDAALSATQGFKTMRPYALINLFFEPAFRVVLTVTFIALGWGLRGAVVALLLTSIAAAILAGLALRGLMGRQTEPPRYIVRELFSYSVSGWFASLASNWLLYADTMLLGFYRTPAEVGVYQVASRITLLAAIVIGPLSTSFAPRAADLYRRGLTDSLHRAYASVTSWMVRLYIPAFIVLLLFSRQLLEIFGPGFVVGAPITLILAAAQFINAGTGPCGTLLLMSHGVVLQMTLNVAALVTNVALNLWLIPRHGAIGAAIAWGACIALFNLIRVAYVRVEMGFSPLDRRIFKSIVAGAAAFLCGLLIHEAAAGFLGLAIGGPSVVIVYFGALALLGLDDEDHLVLATLRRRLAWGV